MELIFAGTAFSVLVLLISILVTIPFSSWLANRVGAIDLPGEIKIHSQPTPRLGGLGILLAFVLSLSVLLFFVELSIPNYPESVVLIVSLISLATIGYLDDVQDLPASPRLVLEGIIGVMLVISVIGTDISWIILGIAWFWIVGLINAYNFLDGLDGLAGSIATVNLLALGIMLFYSGNGFFALVAAILALATCGFLCFNWPPATVFMGDVGSLSLGFVISTLSLILIVDQNLAVNAILAVTLSAALPLGDLVATVFRRLISGQSLFQGDRGHFYDLLVNRVGLSKPQAMYYSLSIALLTAGFGIVTFMAL